MKIVDALYRMYSRLKLHARVVLPVLCIIALMSFILIVELQGNLIWQGLGYSPYVSGIARPAPGTLGANNFTTQHSWLGRGLGQYEFMDFGWDRTCKNIDLQLYTKELTERVRRGSVYHVESERINFVLSSDSHTAAPLEDELDMILPLAHKLPSMLYRCAIEAAITVNPSHRIVLYARTNDVESFINAESERNPAFKVLTQLPNFEIVAISSDRAFFSDFEEKTGIDTPLKFLNDLKWREDGFLGAHLSDLYRLLIMYLHGGVYQDLDAVAIQDMRRYPTELTWVVSDKDGVPKGLQEGWIVNGVFGDVKGGLLTETALGLFAKRYQPNKWGLVGPRLLTESARLLYDKGLANIDMLKTWDFLPIHWSKASKLFSNFRDLTPDERYAVAHSNQLHVFGGASLFYNDTQRQDESSRPPTDSVLAAAMINRCPITYCSSP